MDTVKNPSFKWGSGPAPQIRPLFHHEWSELGIWGVVATWVSELIARFFLIIKNFRLLIQKHKYQAYMMFDML